MLDCPSLTELISKVCRHIWSEVCQLQAPADLLPQKDARYPANKWVLVGPQKREEKVYVIRNNKMHTFFINDVI